MSNLELENTSIQEITRTNHTGSGLAWLVLSATLWGTVGICGGLIQQEFPTPSLTVGFLRMAFAAAFLFVPVSLFNRSNPLAFFRLTRHEWSIYSLMGLAMAGYQLFYFTAIPLASVTLVVVVALCSSPIIVALLSIPVFKEHLNRQIIVSLVLALGGTGLLAFGKDFGGGSFFKPEYLLGAILALGAGFCYSSFTILSKLTARDIKRGPLHSVAMVAILSSLMLLPAALFTGNLKLDLPVSVWGLAAYLGVIPTGLAYMIFIRGLRKATATHAAITTLLEPAVAALLAFLVLGESITIGTLAGGLLLLASVALLTRK